MTAIPEARPLRAWWRGLARPGRGTTRHIPFGTFCHVAASMRDAGLRDWTGPLDWVFSSPAMIEACLADRFSGFLDPDRLESVPPGELSGGATRQCRHRLYEESYGLPPLFNHHDPASSAADRASLERAVGRLLQALDQPGRNLLYLMSERHWPDDQLAALADRLGRFRADNRLIVLALAPEAAGRSWSMRPDPVHPAMVGVTVSTRTRSAGMRFRDEGDEAHLVSVLWSIARAGAEPVFPANLAPPNAPFAPIP